MPVPILAGLTALEVGGMLLGVGLLGTLIYKWDQIVKKVKGKKIAILGQRATGKTTLLKFWGCTR